MIRLKDKLLSTYTNDVGLTFNLEVNAKEQIRTGVRDVFDKWFNNHDDNPFSDGAINDVKEIARNYDVNNFNLANFDN